MVDPGRLALIHEEIDGELDAAGRAELARWLLADPEGHALRDDLRRLCTALDSVPAVEPPAQLRGAFSLRCRIRIRSAAARGLPVGAMLP